MCRERSPGCTPHPGRETQHTGPRPGNRETQTCLPQPTQWAKHRGCGRALAPGFGLHLQVVTLRAHACLVLQVFATCATPPCRDPWPNGQWSANRAWVGNLFCQDAGRQGGPLRLIPPSISFPLGSTASRVGSKVVFWEPGSRRQTSNVCMPAKVAMHDIGHQRDLPAT